MKEYIVPIQDSASELTCVTVKELRRGYRELIRCKHCKYRIVTATIEHNEGEITKYYMCNYWHRPTDPEGFCHIAKRARYDSD